MRGLIHKHTIPICGRPIRICFHRETFERNVGYEINNYSIGHTTVLSDVIFLYPLKRYDGSIQASTLSHECYHVVDFVMELTGAEHNEGGTNEHLAYLIGYLVDAVLDALDLDNKMEFGG